MGGHIGRGFKAWVALDTNCTLESFREFRRRLRGEEDYTESERQRLILRRVCKRWKGFAEARSHRRLDSHSPLGLLPPSIILHAADVHYTTEHFSKYLTQKTKWKIVRVDITDTEPDLFWTLAKNAGFHPHIRRLDLDLRITNTKLVHVTDLACFRQLTYLIIRRYDDPTSVSWGNPTTQITLPPLEVLDFQCSGTHTRFPSGSVHLPSLRHLSLWIKDSELLVDTIAPYAPTLRSLIVRYRILDSLPPRLFSLLPKVEEFAVRGYLDGANDYPPSGHPLKRLIVFSQWIDPLQIRQLITRLPPIHLIFSKLEWPTYARVGRAPCDEGLQYLVDEGNFDLAIHQMKELAALCESRGIRLEDNYGRTLAEAEVTDVTKANDTSIRDNTAE